MKGETNEGYLMDLHVFELMWQVAVQRSSQGGRIQKNTLLAHWRLLTANWAPPVSETNSLLEWTSMYHHSVQEATQSSRETSRLIELAGAELDN